MSNPSRGDVTTGSRRLVVDLDSLPPTVTVIEAGRILGIGRSSAYAGVRAGEIPSLRLGRRVVVPTKRLRALLEPSGEQAA